MDNSIHSLFNLISEKHWQGFRTLYLQRFIPVFMKSFFIAVLLLFSLFSAAQSGHVLVVSNLGKVKGKLYIGWYASAEAFRKPDKAMFSKIVAVENKESVEIAFENVPAGEYAIALFLDRNDNGKMDTNLFGIPKEKYGFSNNKYPLTRAASFKEAAFTVAGLATTIPIRLK